MTPAAWGCRCGQSARTPLAHFEGLGVNAIRTSHNPPGQKLLDLCDRLGFLVMDEAFDEFTPGKNSGSWPEQRRAESLRIRGAV